jgi:outer membrane protein assembly factor BamB
MTRVSRVLSAIAAIAALALLASACDYTMPGYDIGRTGFNPETPQNTAGTISATQVNSIHIEPGFPANIPGVTGSGAYQSPPVVAGGYIYLSGVDGVLHVLNAATGVQAWSAPGTNPGVEASVPVVAGSQVFVAAGNNLHAYSTVTRRLQWSRTLASPVDVFSTPLVDGSDVFVETGTVVNHFSTTGDARFTITTTGTASAAPVISGTTLFTEDHAALSTTYYVRAWSLSSRTLLWSKMHGGDGASLNSLTAVNNVVISSAFGWWVRAYDAGSGTVLWTAKNSAGTELEPFTPATVANGNVYFTGVPFVVAPDPEHLYRVDLNSGKLLASATENPGPLTVANGLVYEGLKLRIYNATTLQHLWSPAEVVTVGNEQPVVANGRFYAFNTSDQLVAYGL